MPQESCFLEKDDKGIQYNSRENRKYQLFQYLYFSQNTNPYWYADWKDKGWVRMLEQNHPHESQMKKLEKGEEKIFYLTAALHRAESSQKFIPLQSFGDFFASIFPLPHGQQWGDNRA